MIKATLNSISRALNWIPNSNCFSPGSVISSQSVTGHAITERRRKSWFAVLYHSKRPGFFGGVGGGIYFPRLIVDYPSKGFFFYCHFTAISEWEKEKTEKLLDLDNEQKTLRIRACLYGEELSQIEGLFLYTVILSQSGR